VLRAAAILGALAVVVAGCGGGGKTSHTVVETSKAFADAGIPFTSLTTSNPYIQGQQVFLPFSLNGSALSLKVLAQLNGSDTKTRNGWIAWVFDTDANAQAAVKEVPLDKWGQGEAKSTRALEGNVIVVASGFSGAEKKQLDDAIAALD
jgi:hypothetical protein